LLVFVAIEGPTGVGKTTVAELLARRWQSIQTHPVHLTAEPSSLPLGRWLRTGADLIDGRPLAMALAADRYMHIDHEIIPTLDAGAHVVSDQYVLSSLVQHRIDGLDMDEVWTYNCYVLPPSLRLLAGLSGFLLPEPSR
jgi:dTMP kinase